MIYNTPYQDLIATRCIIQNAFENHKLVYGFFPKAKPGVFFNSTSVGLQVDRYREELVTRGHSRTIHWKSCLEEDPDIYGPFEVNLIREILEEIKRSNIPVRMQPEEFAKAFRFRLDLF